MAPTVSTGSVSRRDFTRLFALGGSAALFAHPAWAQSAGGGAGGGETLAPSGAFGFGVGTGTLEVG